MMWGDKPYHSLDYELKKRYGQKVYRIALQSGMTCPNRDGTLDTRGCIFCSAGGSGDFAVLPNCSIQEQLTRGIQEISKRKSVGNQFVAYFQSFTGTYGPTDVLREHFMEAIHHPQVVALSIGTRPDCLPPDILALLLECNRIKPVWIELGLQSIHPQTAEFIRRGYDYSVFEQATKTLHSMGIEVIVHTILGLPHETKEMFLETITALNQLPIQGIKLQLLHILKDTDLADYMGTFHILDMEEYLDWLTSALVHLSPDITIHRLTGDGPKNLLLAPEWSSKKRVILNTLHQKMKAEHLWQGKEYANGN